MDLGGERVEYQQATLADAEVVSDPYQLFQRWLSEAFVASQQGLLAEPNAMALATTADTGQPSLRLVLLKELDPRRGFIFYTNQLSRKGVELGQNPLVALLMPWHALQRQIRVEGRTEQLPADESDRYFQTRARGSQIGAWASPQSRVTTAGELRAAYLGVEKRFAGDQPVPRPDYWGGYLVRPHAIEFWQGLPNRMHDRIRFTRTAGSWSWDRLAP